MDNKISIPTGPILDKMMKKGNVNLKKYFGRYNIDGIELTMAYKDRLYQYKPNKEDIKWMKDLDYVSVHAPFKLVSKSNDKKDMIKQLDALDNLYNKTDAKTLVVHVHECPHEELFDKYNFNIALENMPYRNYRQEKENKILTNKIKNSKYGFCLDTSHADDWNKQEIKKLYHLLKGKLKQVHLSASIRGNHHNSLISAPVAFMKSLKPLFKTNVPLVLEVVFPSFSKKRVNQEIKFVKNLFN